MKHENTEIKNRNNELSRWNKAILETKNPVYFVQIGVIIMYTIWMRSIVLIYVVVIIKFQPLFSPAFIRCIRIRVTYREFWTEQYKNLYLDTGSWTRIIVSAN